MNNITICVLFFSIISFIVGLNGYKKTKKIAIHKTEVKNNILKSDSSAKILGEVTCHGGLPDMAQISRLQLGITNNSLFLFNYMDWFKSVSCTSWIGIEKFVLKKKNNTAGKSTVLLGPLVPFFFHNNKLRYFIVVKYIDTDQDENYMVFEMSDKLLQHKVYSAIFSLWSVCTRKSKSYKI